jgi:hypothetical protein
MFKFAQLDDAAVASDTSVMATVIKTFSDLQSLDAINGVSLDGTLTKITCLHL